MKEIFTTKNKIQPMISHEQDDEQLLSHFNYNKV
jgi:hypothetical protein